MKKSVISFLLIFIILSVPLFSATMAAANDEIENLRKNIRSIEDIDDAMFGSLENAVLKKYTDVKKGDWYMSVMVKLVGLSALDGSLNNTLDPFDTVTRAMFIKLFIRAMYGTEGLKGLTPSFSHWAALDVKKAEEIGILEPGEYVLSNLSDPITRGEMARIIVKAYKKFEKDPLTEAECRPLSASIKDFDKISESQKADVLIVYGSGIISGYTDGRFGADDVATRAQAAAFIIRFLDKRERAKVTIPKNEAQREPMVLRYDDPYRPMAIEGDTFIKPDGTSVVLKIGPSGVLGEGQGCATELGRIDRGGTPIKAGDLGTEEPFMGQPYLVCEKTGEGHYIREWHAIAERMRNDALRELGHPEEGTTYGPWLRYSRGQWVWTGPIR
ncbi:MAG TPA: S-layer homology domain-containing protein [Clostridiaceae bacterium]|nr:S-layer homology domain-containing protein [Clostridiaceae bacterium]